MKLRRSFKDTRGESALFRRRAIAGFLLILLSFGLLVARFHFLQVTHHDEFVTRSTNNSVKPRALPPPRGLIYDRNGVVLADNVPAFRLDVVPEKVPDMQAMLTELGTVVPLGQDDLDAFKKQLSQSRRFDSVPLKLHLTEDEIDRFAVNRWRFPSVAVVPYLTRHYPLGPLFAHVVGYVSRIDADDLDRLDPDDYKGTSHVGRTGLERYYEDVLHGKPGYELVEVNADGQTQRVLKTIAPTPGENLYLSIDVRMQKAAVAAFDGRPGGGSHRPAQRPDAGDGQRAELRSESFRQWHRARRLHGADHRRRQALAGSCADRYLSAGVDGEAIPGAGRSRIRHSTAAGHRAVDRRILSAGPDAVLPR